MGPEGDLVGPRLARGCRCFAAWEGGTVLGYGWLSSGPEWIGEVGLELKPAAGEAYIWNCVTLEPYRLTGVFRRLVAAICRRARDEGLGRVWIASLRGTAESALRPPGFEPCLRILRKGDELMLELEPGELGWRALAALGVDSQRPARAGAPRRH